MLSSFDESVFCDFSLRDLAVCKSSRNDNFTKFEFSVVVVSFYLYSVLFLSNRVLALLTGQTAYSYLLAMSDMDYIGPCMNHLLLWYEMLDLETSCVPYVICNEQSRILHTACSAVLFFSPRSTSFSSPGHYQVLQYIVLVLSSMHSYPSGMDLRRYKVWGIVTLGNGT